jgi:hypothetical protein
MGIIWSPSNYQEYVILGNFGRNGCRKSAAYIYLPWKILTSCFSFRNWSTALSYLHVKTVCRCWNGESLRLWALCLWPLCVLVGTKYGTFFRSTARFFLAHKNKEPAHNRKAREERGAFIDSRSPLKKQRWNESNSTFLSDPVTPK